MNLQNKFKKLYASIVVSVLLTLSSCTVSANNDQVVDRCSGQAGIAANIMEARQRGAPITQILEINRRYPEARPLLDFFTLEAYKVPRYPNSQDQKQSVVEFSNTIFMLCMNHFDKVS